MRKDDCEQAIRYLCRAWAGGISEAKLEHPSFAAFKSWLSANGYSHYLTFAAVAGPEHDAEMWFDNEFKHK